IDGVSRQKQGDAVSALDEPNDRLYSPLSRIAGGGQHEPWLQRFHVGAQLALQERTHIGTAQQQGAELRQANRAQRRQFCRCIHSPNPKTRVAIYIARAVPRQNAFWHTCRMSHRAPPSSSGLLSTTTAGDGALDRSRSPQLQDGL